MSNDQLTQLLIDAIQQVAPEIALTDIDEVEDIREECDLDSMDYINVLEALQKSSGVLMNETDHAKLGTFKDILEFLQAHQASGN